MPENRQRFLANDNLEERGNPSAGGAESRAVGRLPRSAPTKPNTPTAERSAKYGASFEARFGRVILQHGIAAIPSALFHYQGEIGLKAQHVWFISYILSHKWDEDLPYPSLSHMARCAGVTLRNIQFIKSDLCRAGMLEVTDRYNGKGGRDSNAYDFSGLFAHIEELISEEAEEPNRIGADTSTLDMASGATPAELDQSFVARFGRVIARRGVAAVPRAIFTHQKALGLTPQQVWFVSYIFSFQWSTTLPYPSINKMVQHTGYSRAHLHTIKAELVSAGYLHLVHRTNDQGGQDSNAYDFSGLLDAIRLQLQPDEALTEAPEQAKGEEPKTTRGKQLFSPRRGQSGARHRADARVSESAQNNVQTPYEAEHTGVYEVEQTTPYENEHTGVYESRQIRGYANRQTPPRESGHTAPVRGDSYTPLNGRILGPTKQGGHESEPIQKEIENKIDDSNQPSQKRTLRTNQIEDAHQQKGAIVSRDIQAKKGKTSSIPGFSPYIAAMARDFSTELGDTLHESSNMKQALNLWQASGLDEQVFVDLMHDARKLTRRYQSRPTWDAMGNKMSYYFATLRDLLDREREN